MFKYFQQLPIFLMNPALYKLHVHYLLVTVKEESPWNRQIWLSYDYVLADLQQALIPSYCSRKFETGKVSKAKNMDQEALQECVQHLQMNV